MSGFGINKFKLLVPTTKCYSGTVDCRRYKKAYRNCVRNPLKKMSLGKPALRQMWWSPFIYQMRQIDVCLKPTLRWILRELWRWVLSKESQNCVQQPSFVMIFLFCQQMLGNKATASSLPIFPPHCTSLLRRSTKSTISDK